MKKSFVSLLLLSLTHLSFSQQTDPKLIKIIGDQFTFISSAPSIFENTGSNQFYHLSTTYKGDTIGLSDGTEYLYFETADAYAEFELYRLVLNRFVSNGEWIEFENYVRDSIARRRVMEAFPKYMSQYGTDGEDEEGNPLQPDDMPLNYQTELDLKSAEFISELITFYFPAHERLNHKVMEFDPRKLTYLWSAIYKSEELKLRVNLFTEDFCWAKDSHHLFDIYYRLAEHYRSHASFSAYPVVGLWAMQSQAYMNWKERQLQKQIDERKLPYRIQLTLPTAPEVTAVNQSGIKCVTFPETDQSEIWKITNGEYVSFLSHVKDSMLRLMFGIDTEAGKVFLTPRQFDDDPKTTMPKEDWDINYQTGASIPYKLIRSDMFGFGDRPMNFEQDKNGNVAYPAGFGFGADLLTDGFHPARLFYRYSWIDYKRLCAEGLTSWELNLYADPPYEELVCADSWNCKDLNLDDTDYPVRSGVRAYEDRSIKIVKDAICVYPKLAIEMCNSVCEYELLPVYGYDYYSYCPKHKNMDSLLDQPISIYDFATSPNDLVKNITYNQALAFYHWKFSKYKNETTAIVNNTTFPSEEEFYKIQSGEKVVTPEQNYVLPSPAFRYVIHVYKK